MSHQVRLYMLWGLVATTAIGTLWFDYAILFKRISLYSEHIGQNRKEAQLLRARAEFLPFFKNEQKRTANERANLTKQSSFSDKFDFFPYLDQITKQTNNIYTVSVQEKPNLIFSVQLSGSFNNLLHFILLLRQTQTTIQLGRITKSSPEGIKTDLFLIPTIEKP